MRNMVINARRVLNAKRYLAKFPDGAIIRIAVPASEVPEGKLTKAGFGMEPVVGKRILPDASLSRSAFENSEGKCVVRKDLPKETAERYWEWSWEDYNGETYTDSTYITYERYVREYHDPLGIELVVASANDGTKWITTDPIEYSEENTERIKLSINLLLSLFGRCYPVDIALHMPLVPNRTCDWEILRPGSRVTTETIERVIQERAPKGKHSMYRNNIQEFLAHEPDMIAVGTKGFSGYFVFAYPGRNTVVLESLMPHNATYILDQKWEDLSQMSKSEILNQGLHVDRIYHYSSWEDRIKQYISR